MSISRCKPINAAILMVALASAPVLAVEPSAESAVAAAISSMGRLNGVVLACDQFALSTRIKEIIITEAPKNRQVGEQFEEATSASFLAQGKAGNCPDPKTFVRQIELAKVALQKAVAH